MYNWNIRRRREKKKNTCIIKADNFPKLMTNTPNKREHQAGQVQHELHLGISYRN